MLYFWNMKVRVPKLNPLVFTNSSGEYNVYRDAELKEQLFPYLQPYASTDRITFQFQWDDVPIAQQVTMRIELKYSSDVSTSFYRDYTFTGVTSGGTNYTNYYKQFLTSSGICGGHYVFDFLVSDISEIVAGNQYFFQFTIDAGGDTFVFNSNCFNLISDLSDTKLLRYTQSYYSGNGIYDTYIGIMTNQFWLRLPCYFKQVQPVFEKTIFENYKKDVELISSNVAEKYILHIGGSNGIPDWLIENLKFIFALDTKIIDNIQYELTTDSEFSVEYIDKFNNRMLDIELTKSKNNYYKEFADTRPINVTTTTITAEEINYRSIADVGFMEATIQVNHHAPWRIIPVTANGMNEVSFSQITGFGKTLITARVSKKVSLGTAKTYSFQVNDLITDEKIQNIVFTKPEITTGIGHGRIGDNFVIGKKIKL